MVKATKRLCTLFPMTLLNWLSRLKTSLKDNLISELLCGSIYFQFDYFQIEVDVHKDLLTEIKMLRFDTSSCHVIAISD